MGEYGHVPLSEYGHVPMGEYGHVPMSEYGRCSMNMSMKHTTLVNFIICLTSEENTYCVQFSEI